MSYQGWINASIGLASVAILLLAALVPARKVWEKEWTDGGEVWNEYN